MPIELFVPVLSRRAGLRAAAIAAVGVGVWAAAGCGDEPSGDTDTEVDPLIAQADLAHRDAQAATAAIAVDPDRSSALQTVANERTAHADALNTEIARVAGRYPDGSTPTTRSSASASASATAEPGPPPTLDSVRTSVAESQRRAADLARSQSDYRAGLLASISAACGVHATVVLR